MPNIQSFLLALAALLGSVVLQAQQFVPFVEADGLSYYNGETDTMVVTGFEKARPVRGGIAIARKEGKWGAFTPDGNIAFPFDYDSIRYLHDTILSVRQGKHWRLMTVSHNKISKRAFGGLDAISFFPDLVLAANKKGRWGVLDVHGKKRVRFRYLTPPEYFHPWTIGKGQLKISRGKNGTKKGIRTGLLAPSGKKLVPCECDTIWPSSGLYFECELFEEGERRVVDSTGNTLYKGPAVRISEEHTDLSGRKSRSTTLRVAQVNANFVVVETGGGNKVVVCRQNGKELPVGEKGYFIRGVWLGENRQGQLRAIHPDGSIVEFPNEAFKWSDAYGNHIALRMKESPGKLNWALYSLDGKEVVPPGDNYFSDWGDGLAVVSKGRFSQRRHALLDIQTGDTILPLKYEQLSIGIGGYLQTKLPEQEPVLLHHDGSPLHASEMDTASDASFFYVIPVRGRDLLQHHYPLFYHSEKDILRPQQGVPRLLPLPFRHVGPVESPGKSLVPNRLQLLLMDPNGNSIRCLTDRYGKPLGDFRSTKEMQYWSHGLFKVSQHDGSQGLSNQIFQGQPSKISPGQPNKISQGQPSKVGFLNANNEVVVPLIYNKIIKVSDHVIIVQNNGYQGLINHRGETLLPTKYHNIQQDLSGYLKLKRGSNVGMADEFGQLVVPARYDWVRLVEGVPSLFMVSQHRTVFYVDLQGKEYRTK